MPTLKTLTPLSTIKCIRRYTVSIESIKVKKKIIWTGDDFELHDLNAITASACDLVLTTCPLSALKYREKGYDSLVLHGEDGKINNSQNLKKEIDVLFFGVITHDRKEILDYIASEGVLLKNICQESYPEKILYSNILTC